MSFLPALALAGITTAITTVGATALTVNPTIVPGGNHVFCDARRFGSKYFAWTKEKWCLASDIAIKTAVAPRGENGKFLDPGFASQKEVAGKRLERLDVNTGDALNIGGSLAKVAGSSLFGAALAAPLLIPFSYMAVPVVAAAGVAMAFKPVSEALLTNATYKLKIDVAQGEGQTSPAYKALRDAEVASGGNGFNLSELTSVPVSEIQPHVAQFVRDKKPDLVESINEFEKGTSTMPVVSFFLKPVAAAARTSLDLAVA